MPITINPWDEKQWKKVYQTPKLWPFGISNKQEMFIPLPSGCYFVFPNSKAEEGGASYVRFVNSEGGELAYWTESEWAEDPIGVMGAICGCMADWNLATAREPNYYQFAPDCLFPPHIDYEPCSG